jgi:hypothetical protein
MAEALATLRRLCAALDDLAAGRGEGPVGA